MLLGLLRDPRSAGNISDAGAHGKMFCGAGDNVFLLNEWVRDRKLLRIEKGIHIFPASSRTSSACRICGRSSPDAPPPLSRCST